MKIDKEYAATHSSATSWFGIDEEGNVAVIEFEDNGPVPYDCGDQSVEDLINCEMSAKGEDGSRSIGFSDEQASELEKILKAPTLERLNYLVLVKIAQKDVWRFKELCVRNWYEDAVDYTYVTVNKNRGLYVVDFTDWDKAAKQYLLDNNIVSGVADWEWYTEDEWSNELQKWVFYGNREGLPFYFYNQPYNFCQLTERTFEPRVPFRAEQLSEDVRRKALMFPVKFREAPLVQISEYFQASTWGRGAGGKHVCEGVRVVDYNRLPLADGSEAWIRCGLLGNLDCSRCWKCYTDDSHSYHKFDICQNGLRPTILHLFAPVDRGYYRGLTEHYYVALFRRPLGELVISMPLIGGLPIKDENMWLDDREYEKILERQDVNRWFGNCKENFEEGVRRLAPRVVVVSEAANEVIERFYLVSDNVVEIDGREYPYFVLDENSDHLSEIVKLGKLPYRGDAPRRIERIVDDSQTKDKEN